MNVRRDLNIRSPLLISNKKLIYPANCPTIIFKADEEVSLSCPGESNHVLAKGNEEIEKKSLLTIKCKKNSKFILTDDQDKKKLQHFSLGEFYCFKNPEHIVKSNIPTYLLPCEKTRFLTGFPVDQNVFIRVLDICYDKELYRPILIVSTVSPRQRYKQQRIEGESLSFKEDEVHKDMNFAYIASIQKEHFDNVFGKDQKYIRLSSKKFFYCSKLIFFLLRITF